VSSFIRPVIGPKVYIARGPSGQIETFVRDRADEALRSFLGNVTLPIAVEGFIRKKARDRTPDAWPDVLSYLGALLHIDPDHVPLVVSIAFWAHVHLHREAISRAKLICERGN
jgi:hypothetical protein